MKNNLILLLALFFSPLLASATVTISGTGSICAGGTSVLTGSPAGGTWSSVSDPLIISMTGTTVTGITQGTSSITYYQGGSYAVKVMTVTSAPTTGPSTLCIGTTMTLVNPTTSGGTWSSLLASATVGATTGIVTPVNTGSGNVRFTAANGCTWNHPFTIYGNANISGTTTVCKGQTTTLSNSIGGGTWGSSNANASVTSGGLVTGLEAGSSVISYTNPNGCVKSVTVTINAREEIIGPVSLCVGQISTLSNAVTGGTWHSGTASITINSTTGVATGVSAPYSVITYTTASGCKSMKTISVTTTCVNESSVSICNGSTLQLPYATTGSGTWSGGGSYTAVSTTGVVTAVAEGTATTSYSLSSGCSVLTPMSVSPCAAIVGPSNVCMGQTILLTNAVPGGTWSLGGSAIATINPTSGLVLGGSPSTWYGVTKFLYITPLRCTTEHYVTVDGLWNIAGPSTICKGLSETYTNYGTGGTWSSSNTSIAIVTSGGVVTGVDAGIITLSYTMPSGCVAEKVVTILDRVPITGPDRVCMGQTIVLSNTVPSGTWTARTGNITVNSTTGAVLGLSPGYAVVRYSLPSLCFSDDTIMVDSLYLTDGPSTICKGLSETYTNSGAGGTWSSSDPSIAVVSSGGVVTGIDDGIITLSYTMPSGCVAEKVVTILDRAPITGPDRVCMMSTIDLDNIIPGGTWVAMTGNITVDADGVVFGGSPSPVPDTAVVRYTLANSCFSLDTIIVDSFYYIDGPSHICQGVPVTYTNFATTGTWISSDEDIAVVTTGGVVTGLVPGVFTLSYSMPHGCMPTKEITVVGVDLISGPVSVCVGSTITLGNAVPGGTWSSSNSAIAAINTTTRVVTGNSVGVATISYLVYSSFCGESYLATYDITVMGLPDAGTITGSSVVLVGGVITLDNAVPSGTWSSSTTGVAVIGATTGIVTGVGVGLTTISYGLSNTCGTAYATKVVTVETAPVCDIESLCSVPYIYTIAGYNPDGGPLLDEGEQGFAGDGDPATDASVMLNFPYGVCTDDIGNVYIADTKNHRIRKVDIYGVISTIAGTGVAGYNSDGIDATAAKLNFPMGVACDASGNIYVADSANHRIRKITTGGIISTYAGTGVEGLSGNGGSAVSAKLDYPINVAFDNEGNLLVVDFFNNMIRKVNSSTGIITRVAGTGSQDDLTTGFTPIGDGGQATEAIIYHPTSVACDAYGNLFVSDEGHVRVRKVNTSGIISTIAGRGRDGFSSDGGLADTTLLNETYGVAVDECGVVYLSDRDNYRIRKVTTAGIIQTIAGTGEALYDGDGAAASAAKVARTYSIHIDKHGDLYICDAENSVIRKIVLHCGGEGRQGNPVDRSLNTIAGSLACVPNPNEGKFQIAGTIKWLSKAKQAKIEILNVQGQTILLDNATLTDGTINKAISLNESVANGVYLMRVSTADGSQMIRFVLSR